MAASSVNNGGNTTFWTELPVNLLIPMPNESIFQTLTATVAATIDISASPPTNSSTEIPYQQQLQNTVPYNIASFKLVMTILYAIIFLIGVPGNILVLLTIIRIRKMRSVKNVFIANLAVGDLLNLLWCMTTFAVGLYVPWPYGESVCKYIYPMSDVIIGNTIYTMVAIAFDRYRAIVQPFSKKLTLRKSIWALLLLWVLSYLIMGLPVTLANRVTRGYWVAKVCRTEFPSRTYELAYRMGIFTTMFCIPLVAVLYCFIKIRKKLKENIKFATSSVRSRSKLQRAKKNEKLINMLFVIFICFTLCYLPVNVLILLITFSGNLVTPWPYLGITMQLAIAMLFANSIMNPIILYRLSRDYRMSYISNLYCIFCCKHRIPNEIASDSSLSRLRAWAQSSQRFSQRSHSPSVATTNSLIPSNGTHSNGSSRRTSSNSAPGSRRSSFRKPSTQSDHRKSSFLSARKVSSMLTLPDGSWSKKYLCGGDRLSDRRRSSNLCVRYKNSFTSDTDANGNLFLEEQNEKLISNDDTSSGSCGASAKTPRKSVTWATQPFLAGTEAWSSEADN